MDTGEPTTVRWSVVKGTSGWVVWSITQSPGRVHRLCVHRASSGADAHRWACDRADQYRRLIAAARRRRVR